MDKRKTTVTGILKIEDFTTRRVLSPDDITVFADGGWLHPVFKPDGYYVFTQYIPKEIQVRAEKYYNAHLFISSENAQNVRTLALLPRLNGTQPKSRVSVSAHEAVWMNYRVNGSGYYLQETIEAGADTLHIANDDFADLVSHYLLLSSSETNNLECVFITSNLGYGIYKLAQQTKKTHFAGNCEVRVLQQLIADEQGILEVPQVSESLGIYIYRANESISIINWEET